MKPTNTQRGLAHLSGRNPLLLVLGLSLAGLVGCGADEADEMTIESYTNQLATINCDKYVKCCDAEEQAATFEDLGKSAIKAGVQVTAVTDQASCEATWKAFYSAQLAEWLNESVALGRGEFVPAKAAACLAAARSKSCADDRPVAACKELMVPKVSLGGECAMSSDCAEGACVGGLEGPMTCIARQPEGAACPDWLCVEGFYCDADSMTCVAVKADGAACLAGEECQNGHCNAGTCGARDYCLGN